MNEWQIPTVKSSNKRSRGYIAKCHGGYRYSISRYGAAVPARLQLGLEFLRGICRRSLTLIELSVAAKGIVVFEFVRTIKHRVDSNRCSIEEARRPNRRIALRESPINGSAACPSSCSQQTNHTMIKSFNILFLLLACLLALVQGFVPAGGQRAIEKSATGSSSSSSSNNNNGGSSLLLRMADDFVQEGSEGELLRRRHGSFLFSSDR
jgi:hypothetical protein